MDIGKSVYRPLAAPQQIDELLNQLLAKANRITDPFEQSFFIMVHLPYLQPFADINKRTSRFAANLPLFRANLCPLTFLDVPEAAYSRATLGVYEVTRLKLFNRPFFNRQARHSVKLLGVVGDQHAVFSHGMGGNHQVHTTYRLSCTLKGSSNLRVVVCSTYRPR